LKNPQPQTPMVFM